FFRFEIDRRSHGDTETLRGLVDGRFVKIKATPTTWARRLGIDSNDLVPGLFQSHKRRDRELRRAHENNAKSHHNLSLISAVPECSQHDHGATGVRPRVPSMPW